MTLWIETGSISMNKHGETLCGDKVELAGGGDEDLTLVLADGLGSGVKANILSTLTSKILCTMISGGIPLEECVSTIRKHPAGVQRAQGGLFDLHHHPHSGQQNRAHHPV